MNRGVAFDAIPTTKALGSTYARCWRSREGFLKPCAAALRM